MNARKILGIVFGLAVACGAALAQAPPLPNDLEKTQGNLGGTAANWPHYGGNYAAWRYSTLTQIDRTNVKDLEVLWSVDTGMHDAFECSPIVLNGIMYVTTPWNNVMAMDAGTGKILWRYAQNLPKSLPLCCGAVNRGAAVGRGKVFFTTLDARIVALDAQTGKLAWETVTGDYKQGYSQTVAPMIVGNKIIVGSSGGDYGISGFIDAYDADTGKQVWRFNTIPQPGQPGHDSWAGDSWKIGGGPSWMPVTYDPPTNTLFAGIGNPAPDLNGENRAGDNLYTECTVALDAGNGKLKWHFQLIPHDVWDLDNVTEQIIDNITVDGKPVEAVMCAGKNGFVYVWDRTNGKCLYASQYVDKVNWGTVDPDGTPHPDKAMFPVSDRWTKIWPGASGGKEWCPVAYDPQRKLLFIPTIELPHYHRVIADRHRPGLLDWGGASIPAFGEGYGHLVAFDVQKKKIAWNSRTDYPVVCGVCCTASGLVITGTPDQKMLIFDADNGQVLKTFQAPSGWHSAPVVYEVGGNEVIGFANGWGGWVTGFADTGTPKLRTMDPTNTMFAFALPASMRKSGPGPGAGSPGK